MACRILFETLLCVVTGVVGVLLGIPGLVLEDWRQKFAPCELTPNPLRPAACCQFKAGALRLLALLF